MFDKSYAEMLKVDVKPYLKQRDGADYLPWAACKQLLHDNGAEVVMFHPIPGPDGSTLHMSSAEFKDKNGVANRVYAVSYTHLDVYKRQACSITSAAVEASSSGCWLRAVRL